MDLRRWQQRRIRMSEVRKYVKRAFSMGMTKAKIINTDNIVVKNWVRIKCQYGCGGYGRRLTCPPYSPTPEYTQKMVGEYSKALLMQIEDISPKKQMKMNRKLENIVAELEREIFLDGYYKAFGMASGPCRVCQKCDTSKPCKYPDKARPAMEACGIDVYQTVRNSGFRLEVVKEEDSCWTYNGLILVE
jgi:predicted metal-binding protein